MKRFIVVLLALIVCASMVFAGGGKQKAGGAAPGQKRILFSNPWYTAPYSAPLMEAAMKKAAELGYFLQIVDGEGNTEKQLSQFRTAHADGYDGFIYWPGDLASTPTLVDYLKSTGKPWVVINMMVDESVQDQVPSTTASDEVEIGRWLGRLTIEFFEKNSSLAKNVAYIEGSPGSSYTTNLTTGINEIIAGKGINILNEPMYSDFDPSRAMAITEDLITRFGSRIVLILSQDGGMFQGAYSAVESAGYLGKMHFICQGQDLIVREKLESGELYASVAQDPYVEGSLAVENLDKLIRGVPAEKWQKVPTGPIYKADVAKYTWF